MWPPMSEDGAQAMAGMLLGLIGLAARFFRDDKHLVKPTQDEIRRLGRAIRETALRRASWMGAFDDLLALAFVSGGYMRRALTEKPPTLPAAA